MPTETAEAHDDVVAAMPTNPSTLWGVLRRQRTSEQFWELISGWVSDTHLARRQAYYRARFAREATSEAAQLYWLTRELYNDVIGAPAPGASPFASRVALDEALARITSLDDWPTEHLPQTRETHELFCELTRLAFMPAAEALDRLKDYTRSRLTRDLPVLPLD